MIMHIHHQFIAKTMPCALDSGVIRIVSRGHCFVDGFQFTR